MQMKPLCLITLALLSSHVFAADYTVSNNTELLNTVGLLQPGDNLILADGTYSDLSLTISNSGTASERIIIKPQNPGTVIFSGQQNILINGDYITFRDIAFLNGGVGPARVRLIEIDGSHIRITGLRIEDFNQGNLSTDTATWIYGRNGTTASPNQYNRIDHNYFKGKTSGGNIVHFAPQDNQFDQIDHNYFSRPVLGENGGSSVRIGSTGLADSYSTIEYNLFERADGEAEIVSVKSGNTTFQYNTVVNSQGEISLRRGHDNTVQNNFFLQTDSSLSYANGVAVRGNNAIVKDNYFDGLTPNSAKPDNAAIAIYAGNIEDVPDDTVFKHEVAKNANVSGNTVANTNGLSISLTTDYLQGNPPKNLLPSFINLQSNTVVANDSTLFDDDPGNANITWTGNTAWGGDIGLTPVPSGVIETDPALARDANGVLRPSLPSGAPLTVADVGPDWFTPLPGQARFVSPANSATDIASSGTTLQWTNGGAATSHDVYFGTTASLDADDFKGNQTALTYITDQLLEGTTYYWRIDAVNDQGTTTGITWSFATAGVGGDNSITILPSDDSYVRSNFPDENNGNKPFVRVRAAGTTDAYLKFNVSGISGTVSSAKLRLYSQDRAIDDTTVHAVNDNNWSESTLTHANAPDIGNALDTVSNIQPESWIEFDITSHITADGLYTLALTSTQNRGGLDYDSSEASSNKPELVITFEAAPSNTPPEFKSDPFTKLNAMQDTLYNAGISGKATDSDGDPLSFTKLSGPAWLTIAASGNLSGTPGAADVGLNSFLVKVEDDRGGSDTATLNIIVDPSPQIAGDVNGDGNVDMNDYMAFLSAYGSVQGDANYNSAADMNNDGVINFTDFQLWYQAFILQAG